MNLNKDPESWSRVKPEAIAAECSAVHQTNVLKMALQDIARLAAELESVRQDRDRITRNRDMWKGQSERQAEQLRAFTSQLPSHHGATE